MTVGGIADLLGAEVGADIVESLRREAHHVEEYLSQQVRSEVRLVDKVAAETLAGGGKRLRPALVSISALACDPAYDVQRARRLGACMEMIHMATLIHDDVVDHAPTRRGSPTAAATCGSTASVLGGDVLLARAMRLLAADGDLEIIRLVAEAVVQMAEGQVLELEARGNLDIGEAEHLAIVRQKTAIFIQVCCEVGALVGSATSSQREALGCFGHHAGMAFQLADDLLDYSGDPGSTGKGRATDFREGCATLPLIRARGMLSQSRIARLRQWFGNGVADADIQTLCMWLREAGSLESVRRTAESHIEEAILALKQIPSGEGRDLLKTVARFVVARSC